MQRPYDDEIPPSGEPRLAWWQHWRVAAGAALAIVLLAIACAWLAVSAGIARERMALMQERAAQGFLAPPSTARSIRRPLQGGPAVQLGGGMPESVELLIAARLNDYKLFRVSFARDDGTTVMHFDRLQCDSNGDLRFALNSTLLPPGSYTIRIEGFTWRGDTVPLGRVALLVARQAG